ncbi:hypothetical protein RINTHH_6580 [Richelia intracellularis HH01]|uniref:Uncharacterized protein n=1 Tax=Richelia intracellularis HH01 TaxID=1165094 RepID=M1WZH6_9NOST|nr:hypothetical protein [Richelia intracellularis]CCH66813.1 hypothetical protein RINTHH_6580 [Richelia intracellularis HH01]
MLQSIGIDPSEVIYNGNQITNASDKTLGYIEANGLDPFRRIISNIIRVCWRAPNRGW